MRDFLLKLSILLCLFSNVQAAAGEWEGYTDTVSPVSASASSPDSAGLSDASADTFFSKEAGLRAGLGYCPETDLESESTKFVPAGEAPAGDEYGSFFVILRWWGTHQSKLMDGDGFLYRTDTLRFYCGNIGFDIAGLGYPKEDAGAPYYYYDYGSKGDALPSLSIFVFEENEDGDKDESTFVGRINIQSLSEDSKEMEYSWFVVPEKRGVGYGASMLGGLSEIYGYWRSLGAPIENIFGRVEISNMGSVCSNIKAGFIPVRYVYKPRSIPTVLFSYYCPEARITEMKRIQMFPDMDFETRSSYFIPPLQDKFEKWRADYDEEEDEEKQINFLMERLLEASDQEEFDRNLDAVRQLTDYF